MRKKLAILGAALTVVLSTLAQAQWAVIDVGAIAQLIQEAATLKQQLSTIEQQLTQAQQQFNAARGNAALLQVTTQQAYATASNRFASVQQLISAIPTATDQKGILDLQARIQAELGMLQNEQTKLQTLYRAVQSQAEVLRQQ